MGSEEIPETFEAFEKFLDGFDRDHFLFDEGRHAVADSTLDLLCTFPPNNLAPAPLIKRFSSALMDDPLLDAFAYRRPSRLVRTLSRGALKARARLVRFYPVRSTQFARDLPNIRSYPTGSKWRNWAPSPDLPRATHRQYGRAGKRRILNSFQFPIAGKPCVRTILGHTANEGRQLPVLP